MDKSNRYFTGYIVGILLSVALGITVGVLVNDSALTAFSSFAVIAVVFAAAAVTVAFVLSLVNVYNRNCALSKQLDNHILLLIIGAVMTVAFSGIFALLVSLGTATGVTLQVLAAFIVLSFGVVLTAVLSFIYWLIKRSRVYTEE